MSRAVAWIAALLAVAIPSAAFPSALDPLGGGAHAEVGDSRVSATVAADEGGHAHAELDVELGEEPLPAAQPPSAPRDARAALKSGVVLVEWDAPERDGGAPVTSYRVYRAVDDGDFRLLAETARLAHTDADVLAGHAYRYRVTAVNLAGEGPASNEAKLGIPAPKPVPPGAPTDLAARGGVRSVSLRWSAPAAPSAPALGYRVYRDGAAIAQTNETGYVDGGLADATTYTYHVTALGAGGESPPSNKANATTAAPPGAPQDLLAKGGAGRIDLAWQPPREPSSMQLTYRVYVFGQLVGETNLTRFADEPLAPGANRTYTVTAVNVVGEGPHSNKATATAYGPPSPPRELRAEAARGSIALTWLPPADDGGRLDGYVVHRDGAPLARVRANHTSFVDGNATVGVEHRYHVTALGWGESAPSNEARATLAAPPSPPQNLTAKGVVGGIVLSWRAPRSDGGSPITGYVIVVQGAHTQNDSRAGPSRGETWWRVGADVTSFNDTSVRPGETRTYVVFAENAVGRSVASNAATGTAKGPPSAPRDVQAMRNVPSMAVRISWLAPESDGGLPVLKYRVYRDGILVAETTALHHWDETCALGAPCAYAVSAVNAIGEGARSVAATPVH